MKKEYQGLNNHERELQVSNDEALYNMHKISKLSMTKFLKQYRADIDNYLKSKYPGTYG